MRILSKRVWWGIILNQHDSQSWYLYTPEIEHACTCTWPLVLKARYIFTVHIMYCWSLHRWWKVIPTVGLSMGYDCGPNSLHGAGDWYYCKRSRDFSEFLEVPAPVISFHFHDSSSSDVHLLKFDHDLPFNTFKYHAN